MRTHFPSSLCCLLFHGVTLEEFESTLKYSPPLPLEASRGYKNNTLLHGMQPQDEPRKMAFVILLDILDVQ